MPGMSRVNKKQTKTQMVELMIEKPCHKCGSREFWQRVKVIQFRIYDLILEEDGQETIEDSGLARGLSEEVIASGRVICSKCEAVQKDDS